MWWLLAVPAGAVALFGCGTKKKRETAGKSQRAGRSSRSGRSRRSSKSRRSRSRRSGRSRRSRSRRGRSSRSHRRRKSQRGSSRSRRSRRGKSSRSKSRSRRGSKSSRSRRSKSKSRSKSRSRRSRSSRSGRGGVASLPAKPSELRVEPAELSYKAIGGLKGVSVINDTQERKFFKVKCSDNMLYRVNPVFGSVEPGKSARIDILRQNGGAKIDKIVLVTTRAEDGEVPCREVFNQARATEMMVLPLLVQE
ncbi:unnamed protein product [Cylicocyclus nassatus]|uniref:Major sperm protein n=1 Tax=Cylicocyclus nassatus TaxID=53992 RepID=A0AA36GM13_CYLNA|nr:unnamed protein product [Cylicocyclus nassatus]